MARELRPCGTLAAHSRHRRRGEPIDQACKDAAAEYAVALRARKAHTPADQIPHGYGGYVNYSCRCPVCSAARTEADHENRRRQALL